MKIFFALLLCLVPLFAAKPDKKTEENLKKQMEKEQKYAKEQRFYKGDEYDLKDQEVDPETIDSIPEIEPEYDFDITDVYRDDI